MNFTTVFFDLDDTLYPADSGLWPAIRARIGEYMQLKLGIPAGTIQELRQQYFEKYGTTLRGLELHYRVDRDEYLAYVHALPLEQYIGPNPALRAALLALPVRKYIFTNADRAHAGRVANVLGVSDCFDGVIDINALTPYCKPERPALETALHLAGERDARRCVLIDDLPHTTRAAREFGMTAILCGATYRPGDADASLLDWSELPALLHAVGQNAWRCEG